MAAWLSLAHIFLRPVFLALADHPLHNSRSLVMNLTELGLLLFYYALRTDTSCNATASSISVACLHHFCSLFPIGRLLGCVQQVPVSLSYKEALSQGPQHP